MRSHAWASLNELARGARPRELRRAAATRGWRRGGARPETRSASAPGPRASRRPSCAGVGGCAGCICVRVRPVRAVRPMVRPGSGKRKAAGAAARLPHQLLYVRQQCASGRNEYILLQTCAGLVYKVGAQSMARPLRTQITQFMRTRAVYTATCMLSHADRTSKCPQNMRNLQRYKVRAAAALSIRRRHTCCARAAVSAMAAPHAASQRIDERAEISQHRCCGGAGGRLASKT